MAHFAHINQDSVVDDVIVAEQDVIDTGEFGDPASWIQTSYNTRGGVHYGPDGQPDGGVALRKNYAGIGFVYDAGLDAFYAPKPYPSWVLDTATCYWQAPVPCPGDEHDYTWDEAAQEWVPTNVGG